MDELLTTEQVAEGYPFAEATLRYWRHKRVGPPWARLGKRVVYRRSDVEEWINQQFVATAARNAS